MSISQLPIQENINNSVLNYYVINYTNRKNLPPSIHERSSWVSGVIDAYICEIS